LRPYHFILVIAIIIDSCSAPVSKKTLVFDPKDTSFLADKNFPYKNVTDYSKIVYNIYDGKLYADTVHKFAYIPLTSAQRKKWFGPLFKKVGETFAETDMNAWFVSKQKKTGELQPLIIHYETSGDYSATVMIVLNRNSDVIACFDMIGNPKKNK
jgi:hypothetical protein